MNLKQTFEFATKLKQGVISVIQAFIWADIWVWPYSALRELWKLFNANGSMYIGKYLKNQPVYIFRTFNYIIREEWNRTVYTV